MKRTYLLLMVLGLFALSACDDDENTEWRDANQEAFEEIENSKEWKAISVTNTNSSIYYKVVQSGDKDNASPEYDDRAYVLYKGWYYNGEVFDKGTSETNEPTPLYVGQLIPGFTMALLSMKPGDKWQICIPYELGYGKNSYYDIPGYSTLFFEVELVRILTPNN